MSDSGKKPGVRDISDLKARLGLKKGGRPGKKAGPGVVPPPGRLPGGVPAPPGAEPPGPKAADDPFAAMNAMAAQHAAVRAAAGPEIVVVERGGPVESVERKSHVLDYLKFAALILVPLVMGIAVGQISSSAKQYNRTIHDAGDIQEDLKKVRQSLVQYQYAFLDAKKRGVKPNDQALNDALEKVEVVPPDIEVVYKSWLYELDPKLVSDVLYFYSEARMLQQNMGKHITLTKKDSRALATAEEKQKAAEPDETENRERYSNYRFAALAEIPTEQEANDPTSTKRFGVTIVEIGMPICVETGQSSKTGECPSKPKGFLFRTNPAAGWKPMDVAQFQPGATKVDQDVLIPLQPSGTFEALVKGNTPSVAEMSYIERIKDLMSKTDELIDLATELEGSLKAKSSESEKFDFFL